jgi:peptidoglycan/LPS O-acetylase OafA/YrhL
VRGTTRAQWVDQEDNDVPERAMHTPSDPTPLTGEEQAVLASISDHEHRTDARFAEALSEGVPPARRRPRRTAGLALAGVTAVAVAPLVLPSAYVLAVAAVALLVVVPTGLVVWAMRQGHVDPDAGQTR